MNDKPFAQATERNSKPILGVLRKEFAGVRSVLEIGSGTGQHAVRFAAAMPNLDWQPSDLEAHHDGMRMWFRDAALANVRAPLVVDVRTADLEAASFDAVFSANTAHIMDIGAVADMFALGGRVLRASGVFCLYGPFRRAGEFNAASNREFDAALRARDAAMGIRDLEHLDEIGEVAGMRRRRLYAMPANNHLAIWKRGNA